MNYVQILLLVTVVLVLLGGLVSLGVGHRGWNIGTVVAGFLVLLAAAAYLYLSARLADRERAWARKVNDYKLRLAKAEFDQAPDADGRPAPPEWGPQSLDRLREERDRWRRGLDRVDTWHGRVWQGASFQPPKDDDATGRVELAADANAEDSPPISEGSHIFLFDSVPFEDGGAYLGEFLVEAQNYDRDTKRHTLTVRQTAPRDAYDASVLKLPHETVTVFEDLPVDRWLAFYRSRRAAEAAPLPEPMKEDADKVRELLESSPAVAALVDGFVETFKQHEEDVPKDEWEAAAAEAHERPGTLWAEVEFTKDHTFAGGDAAPDAAPADDGAKRDFALGDRTEFDLETALELRDADAATIERVFRRRPLTDALTLLHGSRAATGAGPDDGVRADGAATLLRLIRDEIAALEQANDRLTKAITTAKANTDDEAKVAKELRLDLTGEDPPGKKVKPNSWRHDVEEADKLVDAFQRKLDETKRDLRAAEAAIVARGQEFTALMTRLAREIDRVAPPPERRAAKP